MNPYLYTFTFQDLDIGHDQIERVMGYKPGTIPHPFNELIDDVLANAAGFTEIQGGYIIEDNIAFEKEKHILSLKNVPFDIHRIIFHQIKKAEKIAVFVCTAGPKISEWSKELMSDGDLMKGYVVDVIGSEIVEAAMDRIQNALVREMSAQGVRITNRYSPGYCGWIVAEQHKLFSLLPEKFAGVTLTESALMYPIKSVSGIIGIGNEVKYNSYTCQICDSQNCLYRNRKS